jgi:hypothetical protein
MKTSGKGDLRSIAGKIMMGLVLAAMIGSMHVAPALGEGDHDNGRYEKNRGREHERDRHVKRRHDNRRYDDRERVYVAPRVIYAPPPPPGIGIFFPPVFIRP